MGVQEHDRRHAPILPPAPDNHARTLDNSGTR
jgi:hypothetical protein